MKLLHREQEHSKQTVAVAVGAGVALAAGVLAWQWYRGGRRGIERELEGALAGLEEDVVELLRGDERISGQPIEVAALARGIVELSGRVETQEDSDRAMAVAQRATGVRTVLNRLDVVEDSERAAQARRRPEGPGTPRADTRWTGLGVGMGRRRQSRETDPARRDDRVDLVQEALGVDRAVEQTSEILDKIPTATEGGASASHSAPDDRGRIGETSHRGTGNANPFPHEMNAGVPPHENVPPGTQLDLEKAGLEGELERRNLEDKS